MEHLNFCTLFNINYIERGIVLYKSLEECCNEFTLFVVAFDKKTEINLKQRNFKNMIVISYEEFENDILRQAKANRSSREFFWTCGCHSIRYVFDTYKVDNCTYVDADMYFYKNPKLLYQRMIEADCSVGITLHNYPNFLEYKYIEKKNGKYCVEYNTFLNDDIGNEVLDWWCEQCIQCCTENADGIHFGDQKYIEQFPKLFSKIYEYDDLGVGMAPWNISRFVYKNEIIERKTGKKVELFFYHFHEVQIIDEHTAILRVLTRPGKHDEQLIKRIYVPYLRRLQKEGIKNVESCNEKISMKSLIDFCIVEPNVIFLLKKIWRYIIHRKADTISF